MKYMTPPLIGRDVPCPGNLMINFINVGIKHGFVFTEPMDGITYVLCDIPGHKHHVPVAFTTDGRGYTDYGDCYMPGAFTWEQIYKW